MLDQVVEQPELGRTQMHLVPSPPHPVGDAIDNYVAVVQPVVGQARPPPNVLAIDVFSS